jgi:hypothetical protein
MTLRQMAQQRGYQIVEEYKTPTDLYPSRTEMNTGFAMSALAICHQSRCIANEKPICR